MFYFSPWLHEKRGRLTQFRHCNQHDEELAYHLRHMVAHLCFHLVLTELENCPSNYVDVIVDEQLCSKKYIIKGTEIRSVFIEHG